VSNAEYSDGYEVLYQDNGQAAECVLIERGLGR